jgi:hypothetical protein
MARGKPYVFSDFHEGVNLEAAPYSLDTGQARNSLNIHTSPSGSIKKRYGCPKLCSPEVTLNSLFGCNFATDVLIGAGSTKLFKITTTGTSTTLKTGLTSEVPWEWIQAPAVSEKGGPIYGVNGTDTPQYWDGAAAETKNWVATKGSVPNGKYIIYHENRVYIAKGSTLYWASIVNPFDWEAPDGGSTLVDPEDGQEITGIGKAGPYLLIFKNRKTFLLTDSNTGGYRRISSEIGCGSHRSIVETSSGTFFMSSDSEIIVTDGSSFSRTTNQPIRPVMNLVTGANKAKVCAAHIGNYIYFSISEGGSINDTILEYDLVNQAWWPYKLSYSSTVTSGVNQFAILDPSLSTKLYGAGSVSATHRVFEMFVENKYYDNEENSFQAYYITPWHVYSLPHLRKRMREVRVDSLGNFGLYSLNSFSAGENKEEVDNWESSGEGTTFGGTGNFGGTGVFGDEPQIIEKHYYTLGVGRAWSFKFESKDQQDLQIYSYSTWVDFKKD